LKKFEPLRSCLLRGSFFTVSAAKSSRPNPHFPLPVLPWPSGADDLAKIRDLGESDASSPVSFQSRKTTAPLLSYAVVSKLKIDHHNVKQLPHK